MDSQMFEVVIYERVFLSFSVLINCFSLLLDMIFLGTPQLRGGVHFFVCYKVSFAKHSNVHDDYSHILRYQRSH